MQNSSTRFTTSTASASLKRLGGHLVEAGLLTQAQVDVALNDQKMMDGMKFGEVLDARGWVKQQTIEYFMKKIVEPERKAIEQAQEKRLEGEREKDTYGRNQTRSSLSMAKTTTYGESNDRKPLPSVTSSDEDVSWVG